MSSIYGKINFNQKPVEREEFAKMEAALNHWEADDRGQWQKGCAGLGHLMLYNTPESLHEKLPLHNSLSGLTITADARIDNRDELFAKLAIGAEGREMPDSTLILKAYEKYGEDCMQHLIGDFAFAIWDEGEQKLFCARDQMGVKPFFYYRDEHFFAFASEKKGLLALSGLNQQVNEDYLLKITGNIAPYAEETLYTHIKRLTGAHTLILQGGKIKINRYWELDIHKEIIYDDPQQYIDHFLELFREAIRCRLRSAYPVGAELSGGLDSSGIACIAAELLHAENREISSFSYGLTPEDATAITIPTEEHFADEVIRFAKIDHPVKVCSSGYNHFLEETELSLRINDGPHFHTIWHNPVKKMAGERGVRVLLSGFLGDELVTNYSRQYVMEYALKREYLTFFKAAKKEIGLFGAVKMLARIKTGKYVSLLLWPLLKIRAISSHEEKYSSFLTPAYWPRMKKYIRPPVWPRNFREVQKNLVSNPQLSERMEMENRMCLLYKAETRFPMADIRLLAYVLALPFSEKANGSTNRLFYRKAMQYRMPEAVIKLTTKALLTKPFALKELGLEEETAKAWIGSLGEQNLIPDYMNKNTLHQDYFKDEARSILNDIVGMQKKLRIILYWNKK